VPLGVENKAGSSLIVQPGCTGHVPYARTTLEIIRADFLARRNLDHGDSERLLF